MENLLRGLIIVVALGGFSIAFHIRRKKQRSEALICPLNADCEKVIHSDYSTFLGLPLELWGLGYYGLVVLSYLIFIISPATRGLALPQVIEWFTIGAFLFS